jgi:ribosomal-protein-alanine N-acetyltransferase
MIFRPMTEDDLDKVAELEKSIFSTPWSRDNFLESLGKTYSHFFVADMDGVIGYCGIHNLGGDGEITNVAVAPSYRGKKVAYEMLKFAMAETKKKGVEALFDGKELTYKFLKGNTARLFLLKKEL